MLSFKQLACSLCLVLIIPFGHSGGLVGAAPIPDPGTFLASTYFGGTDKDGNLEVAMAVDAVGNIFVAASTKSTGLVPGGVPSYDDSFNGGTYDVIIAKFDNTLTNLLAATYLGGTGNEGDWPGVTMAIDNEGNVYVAGRTNSDDLADMTGACQDTITGLYDAFICRFNNDLDNLLAATYLGGRYNEYYLKLQLDNSGNVVLSGTTASFDYPTTPGAFESQYSGGGGGPYPGDLFVSKLNGDLTMLLGSTFIGGSGNEYCEGIAVDGDNNIYLAGWVDATSSADFPDAPSSRYPDYQGGSYDAFVVKFSPDLTTLPAMTYLGGSNQDFGYGITMGNDGSIYVSGHTASTNFPIMPGAYDNTCNVGTDRDDIFLARLSADLSTLVASTFLGGIGFENGTGLSVDASGNVYVCAGSSSSNNPVPFYAVSNEYSGGYVYAGDGYVAMLDEDLSILKAATYIGGTANECLSEIHVDDLGNIFIAGSTNSGDFPTKATSYDPDFNGEGSIWASGDWGGDVYISKFTFDRFEKIIDEPPAYEGGFSFGVSWIDYDNDDYPDLCVANAMSTGAVNFLYHNNGPEILTDFSRIDGIDLTELGGSLCSKWTDYDNDGDLDAFFANPGSGSEGAYNYLFRNDGGGSFTRIISGSIVTDVKTWTGAAWADYDSDGYLDLFVGNHCPEPACSGVGPSLYRYDGVGFNAVDLTTIGITADVEGPNPAWCDFDNDGDIDLFVAKPQVGTNSLYSNNGDGTFTAVTSGDIVADSSISGNWVDYDNDGDFDLYATYGRNTPCRLYRNDGGSFTKITGPAIVSDSGYWSHGSWGDCDNDGDLDLFVSSNYMYQPQYNAFYQNNNDGTFSRMQVGHLAEDLAASSGTAWADYDLDGDLDLYVANVNDEDNLLYRNRGNGNNWIQIKCVASNGSISPYGTIVRLKAVIDGTPVRQMRQLSSGSGNFGQPDLRLHFGLGDATLVDSIIVQWPGGDESVSIGVSVNQILTITETACGDVNIDGSINVGDAVFLVNLIFHDGPSPNPRGIGDVNCDGSINVGDAVYMTNYIFRQDSPIPCAACP